ncbi:MAG: alpha/beta fold hydrolase [Rickettsiales bacterium]
MMQAPSALPLQLMLAMLQSGISPGGWPSSSAPWQNSLHPFFPWMPKPKTPLEQGIDAAQNLWQNGLEQWQSQSDAWLKSVSLQSAVQQKPNEKNSQPFADFFDPEFITSLTQQASESSTAFLEGISAYVASDYERPQRHYEVLWQRGSAQLFDLAPERTEGLAVLCVPSLINRSTILDLYPGNSLVDYLAEQGFRPLLLDWGSPNADEQDFTTADYITSYAIDALHCLRENHEGPIALVGYCMGGIFTTAMAQLAPLFADALVLLATPWDFAAKDTPRVLHDVPTQLMFRQWIAAQNPVPPMVTQTLFHLIDPWHVQRKYARYPLLNPAERQHFLAIEQWVNDGVPLPARVAEECFIDWPQGNILAEHKWKVGRRWIEPASITCPSIAFIPEHDLVVPKGCALPLTKVLKRCDVRYPKAGHVSMVAGKNARAELWEPLAAWLTQKF